MFGPASDDISPKDSCRKFLIVALVPKGARDRPCDTFWYVRIQKRTFLAVLNLFSAILVD